MNNRVPLLGGEAVAMGAIHAGISGAYSYPGTPSTEIFETVEKYGSEEGIHATWSANEKVAYEEALGMSYAGKRALVSMKHVGLNVAADAFINSAITGVNGGLILCVADDPGMRSSQNEQDSRFFAKFALIPCFEPSNQQEAYDMTRQAYSISEKYKVPVMIRLVTRLAHSRSDIVLGSKRKQNRLKKPQDPTIFTLLPSNARIQYKKLTKKQSDFFTLSETSKYNTLNLEGKEKTRAVITGGIAFNYTLEALGGTIPFPFLKLGVYPIPEKKVLRLIQDVENVMVVEEGYPFIEENLRGITGIPGKKIHGKLDNTLPRTGELDPSIIADAFLSPMEIFFKPTLSRIPPRPPQLCPGCPHIDTYLAINEALSIYPESTLLSDIGCYTLGFYEPYCAIESCVDMGASIGMAAGAVHAGLHPVLCTIGDSTFTHSGMTALITAVQENVNMNVFILDNATIAMTGTQETIATGENLVNLVLGLGLNPDHVQVFTPLKKQLKENVRLIRKEIEWTGLSVLISRRACIRIKPVK